MTQLAPNAGGRHRRPQMWQGEWISISDREPENYSRVIVHRVISAKSYVDVINYIVEPASGIKPLVDTQHIRHWMPLPEAPN